MKKGGRRLSSASSNAASASVRRTLTVVGKRMPSARRRKDKNVPQNVKLPNSKLNRKRKEFEPNKS